MTIEELKEWQRRSLAEFQRKAHSNDPREREEAAREARERLLRAGIIDESGELSAIYR